MKKMSSDEIRSTWLKFFESKGHYIEPSASLIPHNDPTLLWINAGVAALKKYFDGSEIPPHTRITNAQKSLRTNDIENVGKTARHHTFFEMMGNFSIGDYFRNEVIPWAFELLTSEKYFGFPTEKLYITHHPSDTATRDLWIKCGMPADHMIPLEGNFWEIGEGPCGPDTEIFFDRGTKYDPENIGIKLLKEDIENDRYIEIWNIVFSQYNAETGVKREDYKELPSKNIDTGAGLERFACVLQGTDTNFETDLFWPYIEQVMKLSGKPYEGDNKMAYRVIADHIRTCTFALADGAMFSNEGRGYVLRRILRRAVRYGRKLGINKPFLSDLVPTVIEVMHDFYPYLAEHKERVMKMIKSEEVKFASTLEKGENMLKDMLDKSQGKVLSGEDAFKLYDTYGFPVELTVEIAAESSFTVDMDGFNKEMKAQKERARAARGDLQSFNKQSKDLMEFSTPSEFVYFDTKPMDATVIGLFKDGVKVDEIDDEGEVAFDTTNFYATMGGQVADTGRIVNDNCQAVVNDVNPSVQKQHLHSVKVEFGSIKVGDKFTLIIDEERRMRIQRNHSSAHLLQAALQEVLGPSVHQAGSLDSEECVRFDFTYNEKMTPVQLRQVEKLVNEYIYKALPVKTEILPIEEAKKAGAMMLFGEKYGDTVRVVTMGDISKEFCGGTHVSNTSEIGLFAIAYEESIAAGVRRIEGRTGLAAYELIKQKEIVLEKAQNALKAATLNETPTKAASVMNEVSTLKKQNNDLTQKLSAYESKNVASEFEEINGKHVLLKKVEGYDKDRFNALFDSLKVVYEDSIVVLANVNDGRIAFIASVSSSLQGSYQAGNIIKKVTSLTGGNGGGRKDVAQGGGKDASKLDEAFLELRKDF
jgi:alanyl-tRNA synthetase